MTSYWSIGVVVGIFGPLLGGFLFSQLGLLWFLYLTIFFICIAFSLTYLVKKQSYPYGIKEICTYIKGLRTIVMIDGALPTASSLLLTLYLLTFVQGAFDFGLLLSLIALISLSFSFLLAKISDKNKNIDKRRK